MPMKSIPGTPPSQRWVPQSEPLDLDEALGLVVAPDTSGAPVQVHLEDLDPAVQHRLESWPEAVAQVKHLWGEIAVHLNCYEACLSEGRSQEEATRALIQDMGRIASDARDWLAANAPGES